MKNSIREKDKIFEIYNEKKLTPERLKSLINDNHNDLYISSSLIKLLIKENEAELLKIIFDNSKFYDNDFIKHLIYLYKYKTLISTKELNQEISKDKYKILIYYKSSVNFFNSFRHRKTFEIKNMNKTLIYYLVEHGIDINKDNLFKETPLFYACESGNKDLVKYLVKHGTDINKENRNGESVLLIAYESGNKDLVEYLMKHGLD